MYNIKGLLKLMRPYSSSTKDIKTNEVFISISQTYPKTIIKVEYCKDRGVRGDLYTMSDNIYRQNIPGIYKYCPESIEVIQLWQKGYNMIIDIDRELVEMDIKDIENIKKHVNGIKNLKIIKGGKPSGESNENSREYYIAKSGGN